MYVDNFIRVKKDDLRPLEWRRLRRLLTFYPEEGVRARVWREHAATGELWLPRGILDQMPSRLLEPGSDFRDKRSFPKLPKLKHNIVLDYADEDKSFYGQAEAVEAIRKNKQGLIHRQPGTGKTAIALYCVATFGTRAFVLVHTEDILQQWVKYARELIPKISIGIIRQRQRTIGQLTIASVQTMIRDVWDEEFWRMFGLTFVDEAHHAPAASFEAIIGQTTSRYLVGLTASKKRADGMHPLMRLIIGPVLQDQKFSSPVPVTVEPLKTTFRSRYRPGGNIYAARRKWQSMINQLVEDDNRNKLIARRVDKAIRDGYKVLLLSERTEHLARIQEQMKFKPIIMAASGDFKKTKKERKDILELFRRGKIDCILATQLADEALDLPSIDCIVLAFPFKLSSKLLQRVGRGLRESKGKDETLVIDVVDINVAKFRRDYWERRKNYRRWGFMIKAKTPPGLYIQKLRRKAKVKKITKRREKYRVVVHGRN